MVDKAGGGAITAVGVEVGCPYGRQLSELMHEIEGRYAGQLSNAEHTLNSRFSRQYSDTEAEALGRKAEATDRLDDTDELRRVLAQCENCQGQPAEATLTDTICPVAKYAIFRMTLPGNRELGKG